MDMNDIKVESIVRKRNGMQPVTVWNDIRVKHLPTGIVIEIPHEFQRSQHKHLKTALAMLDTALTSPKISNKEKK